MAAVIGQPIKTTDKGTSSASGLVTLSDAYAYSAGTAAAGVAASSYAVAQAYANLNKNTFVKSYRTNLYIPTTGYADVYEAGTLETSREILLAEPVNLTGLTSFELVLEASGGVAVSSNGTFCRVSCLFSSYPIDLFDDIELSVANPAAANYTGDWPYFVIGSTKLWCNDVSGWKWTSNAYGYRNGSLTSSLATTNAYYATAPKLYSGVYSINMTKSDFNNIFLTGFDLHFSNSSNRRTVIGPISVEVNIGW